VLTFPEPPQVIHCCLVSSLERFVCDLRVRHQSVLIRGVATERNGRRPSKVMSKAFKAVFQRMVQRARPFTVPNDPYVPSCLKGLLAEESGGFASLIAI
jgi:hypothetical protein